LSHGRRLGRGLEGFVFATRARLLCEFSQFRGLGFDRGCTRDSARMGTRSVRASITSGRPRLGTTMMSEDGAEPDRVILVGGVGAAGLQYMYTHTRRTRYHTLHVC